MSSARLAKQLVTELGDTNVGRPTKRPRLNSQLLENDSRQDEGEDNMDVRERDGEEELYEEEDEGITAPVESTRASDLYLDTVSNTFASWPDY